MTFIRHAANEYDPPPPSPDGVALRCTGTK